jgi:hypothetical protein
MSDTRSNSGPPPYLALNAILISLRLRRDGTGVH